MNVKVTLFICLQLLGAAFWWIDYFVHIHYMSDLHVINVFYLFTGLLHICLVFVHMIILLVIYK